MKKTQKGFATTIVIATVAVILIIIIGIYFAGRKNYSSGEATGDQPAQSVATSTTSAVVNQKSKNTAPATKKTPAAPVAAPTVTSSAPSITIVAPKKAEALIGGQSYTIQWTSKNLTNKVLYIDLWSVSGNTPTGRYDFIAQGVKNTGTFLWLVSSTLPPGTYALKMYTTEDYPVHRELGVAFSGFFTVARPLP